MLRTRRVGAEATVDVHVQVAPRLTVSEGHMISQAVEDTLIAADDDVTDVTVHIDPENDAEAASCSGLPLRAEIAAAVDAAMEAVGQAQRSRELRLHYLDGKVDIELVLPLDPDDPAPADAALRRRLGDELAAHGWFGGITFLYR
jgi:divalent metal cation (Fe/Co/Zn/Cd) transporter